MTFTADQGLKYDLGLQVPDWPFFSCDRWQRLFLFPPLIPSFTKAKKCVENSIIANPFTGNLW